MHSSRMAKISKHCAYSARRSLATIAYAQQPLIIDKCLPIFESFLHLARVS